MGTCQSSPRTACYAREAVTGITSKGRSEAQHQRRRSQALAPPIERSDVALVFVPAISHGERLSATLEHVQTQNRTTEHIAHRRPDPRPPLRVQEQRGRMWMRRMRSTVALQHEKTSAGLFCCMGVALGAS